MALHKDKAILELLTKDASTPVSRIAEELGLPRTTVQERIKRLREEGVIKQFTVVVEHAKLGKPVTSFILVSFMPGTGVSQKRLAQEIAKLPDVYEVHIITGEWDILLKVRGESMEAIGRLVLERLRTMEGVARTLTCACFLTVKESPS